MFNWAQALDILAKTEAAVVPIFVHDQDNLKLAGIAITAEEAGLALLLQGLAQQQQQAAAAKKGA